MTESIAKIITGSNVEDKIAQIEKNTKIKDKLSLNSVIKIYEYISENSGTLGQRAPRADFGAVSPSRHRVKIVGQ